MINLTEFLQLISRCLKSTGIVAMVLFVLRCSSLRTRIILPVRSNVLFTIFTPINCCREIVQVQQASSLVFLPQDQIHFVDLQITAAAGYFQSSLVQ